MRSASLHLKASVFVALIGISLVAADGPNGPVASDYLKGVAALEAKFAHCSGEAIQSESGIFNTDKPTFARQTRYEFAFSGAQGRLVTTYVSNSSWEKSAKAVPGKRPPKVVAAIAYNEKQSFSMSKSAMNADYVIDALEVGSEAGRKKLARGSRNPLACLTEASAISLPGLVRMPKCHLEKVGNVPSPDGTRRIRFNIKMDPVPLTAKRGLYLTSGWFVTSPDEYWAISEFGVVRAENVDQPSPTTWVGRVEYRRGSDGEIQPVKAVTTIYRAALDADPAITGLNPEKVLTDEIQFTKFRFGDLPAREFTLAAFGMPEFGEPAARRLSRPFPWWIVGASVGFGGLAWVLWGVGKRHRKPSGQVA